MLKIYFVYVCACQTISRADPGGARGLSPPTPIEPPKTLQQISTINDKKEEEMEEEEEENERNKEDEDKNKPLLKFHPRFATDYQVRTSPSKRGPV